VPNRPTEPFDFEVVLEIIAGDGEGGTRLFVSNRRHESLMPSQHPGPIAIVERRHEFRAFVPEIRLFQRIGLGIVTVPPQRFVRRRRFGQQDLDRRGEDALIPHPPNTQSAVSKVLFHRQGGGRRGEVPAVHLLAGRQLDA